MSENKLEPKGGAEPPVSAAHAEKPAEPPYPPIGYSWYVVVVLMIAYIFSFIDRQILNLWVDDIKRDLKITEVQMSLLMGLSFAVFYTFCGIPLGWLADSKSRRGIIVVGLVFWSLMTAVCGLTKRYWQLLLARMGVGVGEAALSPAAYSLIMDYFPKHKVATAMGVYSMGIYLGTGLAYFLPGIMADILRPEGYDLAYIGHIKAWQFSFLLVGLPGVAMALLFFTIKEPYRRGVKRMSTAAGGSKIVALPVSETYRYIRQNWKAFLCHNVGFALLSFSSYGSTAWIPTFLMRTYGMSKGDAGKAYGLIVFFAGAMGVFAGGWIADWLAKKGYRDSKMRAGLIASVVWFPFGLIYPLMPDASWAMLFVFPAVFTSSMPFGAAPAAIQELMPSPMRAQASAVYLFVINLIGLGLGPSAVAAVTQYVFDDDNMIRYSLLIVATAAHIASTILLLFGLKEFLKGMDRLKAWHAANG